MGRAARRFDSPIGISCYVFGSQSGIIRRVSGINFHVIAR